jgi:hypothetical protein
VELAASEGAKRGDALDDLEQSLPSLPHDHLRQRSIDEKEIGRESTSVKEEEK